MWWNLRLREESYTSNVKCVVCLCGGLIEEQCCYVICSQVSYWFIETTIGIIVAIVSVVYVVHTNRKKGGIIGIMNLLKIIVILNYSRCVKGTADLNKNNL